jgi:hypothetical protein
MSRIHRRTEIHGTLSHLLLLCQRCEVCTQQKRRQHIFILSDLHSGVKLFESQSVTIYPDDAFRGISQFRPEYVKTGH